MKPATPKAHELLKKLEALAARGVNGEANNAKKQIERLKKRFDFTAPCIVKGMKDMFYGSGQKFEPSQFPLSVCKLDAYDYDVSNSVKWAIEGATKLQCRFTQNGNEIVAYGTPPTVERLSKIAVRISECFKELWKRYATTPGVSAADRSLFIRGLYDGMMLEEKPASEPLPTRPGHNGKVKGKRNALAHVAGIAIHPYSVAVGLGKQIRYSASIETIVGELENTITAALAEKN